MILPPQGISYFRQPKMTTFAMTGASITVAQNSADRVALIFSCPTGLIFLSISSPAQTGAGIVMVQAMAPIILTWADVGPIVSQQWYCFGTAGSNSVTVTELFYSPMDEGAPRSPQEHIDFDALIRRMAYDRSQG